MIKDIILREICDSRGNKTIEAEVSSGKYTAIAAAPSGASVGKHEVPAFPKGGTEEAISVFKTNFEDKLIGMDANFHDFDRALKALDPKREELGGNTSIALSLAVAKLHAALSEVPLYQLFANSYALPYPIGNVIGGGVHAGAGSPEIQEFLSIPVGAPTVKEAIFANSLVHKKALEKILKKDKSFTRGRDDEGAWAPQISNEDALTILKEACEAASGELGFAIKSGVDIAASELWNEKEGVYVYQNFKNSPEEQLNYVGGLIEKFGLFYIEDPLQEDDFDGFKELTSKFGGEAMICGDDLIVTNEARLKKAAGMDAINSLIVKPNQIGSLEETENVIKAAKDKNYASVVSHRSGETCDTSIAHIAVGFSAPVIKTGIVGGERIAKLNELIRIEERSNIKMAKLKWKTK